jgi:hypothetical protein
MQTKISLATAAFAALLIILVCGCASSGSAPSSSSATAAPGGAITVPQVSMTPYMRSRIGTPDELSPLAPPQARNVHKEGDHWACEIGGQHYIFNGASWVPQGK